MRDLARLPALVDRIRSRPLRGRKASVPASRFARGNLILARSRKSH